MKVRIHDQRHPVIHIDALTSSTIDFEMNSLYQKILVLGERKLMLKEKLESNERILKETRKEFNEKVKLKRRLDKISSCKHS